MDFNVTADKNKHTDKASDLLRQNYFLGDVIKNHNGAGASASPSPWVFNTGAKFESKIKVGTRPGHNDDALSPVGRGSAGYAGLKYIHTFERIVGNMYLKKSFIL
jgi:hypothetical protein